MFWFLSQYGLLQGRGRGEKGEENARRREEKVGKKEIRKQIEGDDKVEEKGRRIQEEGRERGDEGDENAKKGEDKVEEKGRRMPEEREEKVRERRKKGRQTFV